MSSKTEQKARELLAAIDEGGIEYAMMEFYVDEDYLDLQDNGYLSEFRDDFIAARNKLVDYLEDMANCKLEDVCVDWD